MTPARPRPPRTPSVSRRSRRPGFSLMMVTAVVAVAAVMGLAVLATNTLQASATANQDKAVSADALAESGVNLGLYYLQNLNNSTKCPVGVQNLSMTGGAYTLSNATLGANVPGKFTLRITRPSLLQYQVAAIGKATAPDGADVSRTLTAVVDVNYYGYAIMAPNATAPFAVPANTSYSGNVFAPAGSTLSTSADSGGLLGGLLKTVTDVLGVTQVPATTSVNKYLTYNINGVSGVATLLLSTTLSNTTLGPITGNPAGVYYALGNVDLDGGVTVNGTLVLTNGGQLRVQGKNNTITPLRYFPAVVSESDIILKQANTSLDVAGLTYTGGKLVRSGTGSSHVMTVTGALLFAGTNPSIDPGINLKVTYDRHKASVPSLTGATRPVPTGVSIVSWKN